MSSTWGCESKRKRGVGKGALDTERLNYACLFQLMYDSVHRWSHASARAHPISLTEWGLFNGNWTRPASRWTTLRSERTCYCACLHTCYISMCAAASAVCRRSPHPEKEGGEEKKKELGQLWSLTQKTLKRAFVPVTIRLHKCLPLTRTQRSGDGLRYGARFLFLLMWNDLISTLKDICKMH